MSYGFKVWDSEGNIICDGQLSMVHFLSETEVSVSGSGSSYTYSFPAQSSPPAVYVECAQSYNNFTVSLNKDSDGNYVSVTIVNHGDDCNFYISVSWT